MKHFGVSPEETVVFEDSFHGLTAARASGARVVGLATTNPREAIAPYCDIVIDDFTGFTIKAIL
jgi:beta-phosphoglucomutase-like phosphatase (HAD superfamily)